MARLSSRLVTHQLGTLVLSFSLLFCITATLSDDRNDILGEFDKIEQSIQKSTARKELLEKRASSLAAEISNLKIRAAKSKQQAQILEITLDKIDGRLSSLAYQKKVTKERLKHQQADLIQSVIALVRLRRQTAPAILVRTESLLDTIRARRLLAVAVPALQKDASKLKTLLNSTNDLRQKLKYEQHQRTITISDLLARRAELSYLLKKRGTRENHLREAGRAEGRRLAKLASKAKDLNSLLKRIEQAVPSNRFNFGRHGTKIKPNQIVKRPDHNRLKLEAETAHTLGTSPPTLDKHKTLLPKRLSPKRNPLDKKLALALRNQPFSKLRGHLQIPVLGTTVSRFGESSGFSARSQGITLLTHQGAQVVAPYGGRVVFAGPFRNYGLMLIIAHGEGYHTLLAGLSALQAIVGQHLLIGELIGTMGRDKERSLYIELRRKGKPINPNPWWSKRGERVSG